MKRVHYIAMTGIKICFGDVGGQAGLKGLVHGKENIFSFLISQ